MNDPPIAHDHPDAVNRLLRRLTAAETMQRLMRAVNGVVRDATLDATARYARVAAECARHATSIEELRRGGFSATSGFPGYAEINNAATIRRVRRRLEEIGRGVPRTRVTRFPGGRMEYAAEQPKVRIYFETGPDLRMRVRLKLHGFVEQPGGAWARAGGEPARRAAARVTQSEWQEGEGHRTGPVPGAIAGASAPATGRAFRP